jgi:hypothetical protein
MEFRRIGDLPDYPNHWLRVPFSLALLTAIATACHDSPADPLASITTVETVPSLAISSSAMSARLPSLSDVAIRVSPDVDLGAAVSAWEASWDDEDGEWQRTEARGNAVPVLFRALGEGAARSTIESLAWIRSETEWHARLPEELARPTTEAVALLERADEALEEGAGEYALALALEASDRVRSVTSQAVARRLVVRAERLMETGDNALGDVERARHLMNGARRALTEERWEIAIQRAFYACQVLEGTSEGADPDPEPGRDANPDPERDSTSRRAPSS